MRRPVRRTTRRIGTPPAEARCRQRHTVYESFDAALGAAKRAQIHADGLKHLPFRCPDCGQFGVAQHSTAIALTGQWRLAQVRRG